MTRRPEVGEDPQITPSEVGPESREILFLIPDSELSAMLLEMISEPG